MSISGAFLTVTIGESPATLTGVQEWTVEEEAEELDRSSGASEGYGDRDGGIIDATITMRLFFDTTDSAYTPIRAGQVLTNANYYAVEGADQPDFSFPKIQVLRSSKPVKVRGGIYLDITAKNKGPYTANDPG